MPPPFLYYVEAMEAIRHRDFLQHSQENCSKILGGSMLQEFEQIWR